MPGSRWMIASGMVFDPARAPGNLHLVDRLARTSKPLLPAGVEIRPVGPPYLEDPPDLSVFSAHGLHLRTMRPGVHTLYAVHHGSRESVELFEIAGGQDELSVSWIGAILQDADVLGNAVAPLPDGGLVATKFKDPNDPQADQKLFGGRPTGNIKEWHADTGWLDVPGTECSGPNGVDVSADGRWCFIASWPTRKLIRVTLGPDGPQRKEVDLGFLPDNVKVHADGSVLVAGQECDSAQEAFEAILSAELTHLPVRVARVDPDTLAAERLVELSDENFGNAATALLVEDELWMSTGRGDRIAYLSES